MDEFMFSDWLMTQRGETKRLPNYTFEHSSGFPYDSGSAESTDEILSEFSRRFAMLCTIQSAVCIKGTSDLRNSSQIGFPKTVLPAYQPSSPYSQVNTRCEMNLEVYSPTLVSLKSLHVPQCTSLGTTST